jgi:putative hemolysin
MTALILALVGFIALLYFSGVYSGSETAFFSLSRLDLDALDPGGRIRTLMKEPERLLIGILLGNTLVNVAAGSLGALVTLRITRALGYPEGVAIALEVGVLTFIILVVGEVAPKMYAMQRNVRAARANAPLILGTLRAFRPFVDALGLVVAKMQGRLADEGRPFVTAEELRTIVALSEERGTLEEDERDMIDSVMEFGDTVVRELMVPRVDMDSLESATTVGVAIEKAKELGFSRLPVYRSDLDHVVGVLYVKDLLKLDLEAQRSQPVETLVRPAHFTPESKKAGELLREMQRRRIHIAIVVDEYGGTAGLVTLEDLIEEIVGEIRDEYDVEEPLVRVINRSTVVADGMVRLDELDEEIGTSLETEGVETLGGYLMDAFGRIPSEGEKLERSGVEFTIESVEEQRIKRVRIVRLPAQEQPAPEGQG